MQTGVATFRIFNKTTVAAPLVVAATFSPLIAPGVAFAETAVAPEKNPPGDIPDS